MPCRNHGSPSAAAQIASGKRDGYGGSRICHILDELFAAFMLKIDVDVDVRRLLRGT
jgi:hypothetical protein